MAGEHSRREVRQKSSRECEKAKSITIKGSRYFAPSCDDPQHQHNRTYRKFQKSSPETIWFLAMRIPPKGDDEQQREEKVRRSRVDSLRNSLQDATSGEAWMPREREQKKN